MDHVQQFSEYVAAQELFAANLYKSEDWDRYRSIKSRYKVAKTAVKNGEYERAIELLDEAIAVTEECKTAVANLPNDTPIEKFVIWVLKKAAMIFISRLVRHEADRVVNARGDARLEELYAEHRKLERGVTPNYAEKSDAIWQRQTKVKHDTRRAERNINSAVRVGTVGAMVAEDNISDLKGLVIKDMSRFVNRCKELRHRCETRDCREVDFGDLIDIADK